MVVHPSNTAVSPCINYFHIVKQCMYFQNMLQARDISFKYFLKYRPLMLTPYYSRSPFLISGFPVLTPVPLLQITFLHMFILQKYLTF